MSAPPALVLADLHAEWLLDGAPGALPRRLLQRLAAAGSLLRVLCRDDDRLWLPASLAPDCLRAVPGLSRPRLVHGPRPTRAPGEDLLAWMAAPLAGLCDPAAVELARQLSHRRTGAALARDLGYALPGARWVADRHALEAAVAEGAGPAGGWVLKPGRSAAGRGQLRGRRGEDLTRAGAAVERAGGMAYEPWLERLEDLGSAAEVDDGGSVRWVGLHHLLVTPEGAFRGVVVGAPLAPDHARRLREATLAAGQRLAALGHRGPFGLDACLHRVRPGAVEGAAGDGVALHPWVELNPRWTFGRLAAELLAAVGSPGRGCLRISRGDRPLPPAPPGERLIELLDPDPSHDGGGTRAWLSVPAPRG